MLNEADRVASGNPDLDELLDGLILGDNVVWVSEGDEVVRRLEDALLAEALRRGQPCFYVATAPREDRAADPAALRARLPEAVAVLDARPGEPLADAGLLEATILERARGSPPGCMVFDSLGHLARRWGNDRAVALFSRICPNFFDIGALSYWRAPRKDLSRAAIDRITQVTQCVIEVSGEHLRVVKAEGRQAGVQGSLLRLRVEDGTVRLDNQLGLGRLARGLERVRRERNLTQSDLARLGRVTPSAISQAEAGRRGLSLDTLLLLTDRLGVSLDDILSASTEPDYVLARRPRGFTTGRRALLDDPRTGLRAYMVRLKPHEAATSEIVHKGVELVLVASGLVQVTIGADTPVMRAGDAALATRAPVTGWRNLGNEPAALFLVLRD